MSAAGKPQPWHTEAPVLRSENWEDCSCWGFGFSLCTPRFSHLGLQGLVPAARPGYPSWDRGQLGGRSILRHLDLYLICASTGPCAEGKEKKTIGKIINRFQTKTVHYCSVSTLKGLVLRHRCVNAYEKWCHMVCPSSICSEGFAVLHKMTGEQFAYIHGETELLLHCAPEG